MPGVLLHTRFILCIHFFFYFIEARTSHACQQLECTVFSCVAKNNYTLCARLNLVTSRKLTFHLPFSSIVTETEFENQSGKLNDSIYAFNDKVNEAHTHCSPQKDLNKKISSIKMSRNKFNFLFPLRLLWSLKLNWNTNSARRKPFRSHSNRYCEMEHMETVRVR